MKIEVYSALVKPLHSVAPGEVVEIDEELHLVADDSELDEVRSSDKLCIRLADGFAQYVDKSEQVPVMREVKLTCSK